MSVMMQEMTWQDFNEKKNNAVAILPVGFYRAAWSDAPTVGRCDYQYRTCKNGSRKGKWHCSSVCYIRI